MQIHQSRERPRANVNVRALEQIPHLCLQASRHRIILPNTSKETQQARKCQHVKGSITTPTTVFVRRYICEAGRHTGPLQHESKISTVWVIARGWGMVRRGTWGMNSHCTSKLLCTNILRQGQYGPPLSSITIMKIGE